jgi:CRP-like cAMP-binding protein
VAKYAVPIARGLKARDQKVTDLKGRDPIVVLVREARVLVVPAARVRAAVVEDANISVARRFASSASRRLKQSITRTFARFRSLSLRAARSFRAG